MHTITRRSAFTLVEAIVVVAIGGVLLALLLPAVQRARAASARVACCNHMKQIGLALHQYHGTHGRLPVGCSYLNGASPQPHMSWMTRLLPFAEQEALWRQAELAFKADTFFLNRPHRDIYSQVLTIYNCPSDARKQRPGRGERHPIGLTSYLGVEGTNQHARDGLLYLDSTVRLTDVTDGTSHTLAVGERPPSPTMAFGWWYAGWGQLKDGSGDSVLGVRELRTIDSYPECPAGPYGYSPGRLAEPCDAFHFWSLHSGGAHFLFADGSVHFLSYSANAVMPSLATRGGGETVALP